MSDYKTCPCDMCLVTVYLIELFPSEELTTLIFKILSHEEIGTLYSQWGRRGLM